LLNSKILSLMENEKKKSIVAIKNRQKTPLLTLSSTKVASDDYWRWGDDNMMPAALSLMSRRSTTHRRIINDKSDYIAGKGFSYSDADQRLAAFVKHANGNGESLRTVLSRVTFDKSLLGNAFVEVVTDKNGSFLSLYHLDASCVRIARDNQHVILHQDWGSFKAEEAVTLPLYPLFEEQSDGSLRSVIHYKEYEPMFTHYGVPKYIAGMGVSAIAYKTDCWNISRLDNSFQLSGIMMLDAATDNEEDAEQIVRTAQRRFAGDPGQVMFIVRSGQESDNSQFIPLTSNNEGDWNHLHDQATSDIVIAHSWFRSLSGLDYASGFNAERILHEYEVALNTVILAEQEELLSPLKQILLNVAGIDASTLEVINRPPTRSKPIYMKVWEARKADGLEYDEMDERQQAYLSEITKYNVTSIN